jgi:hypothetical protein
MTVAPDRPLHHAYLGDQNPFDLIDTPWGHIERWRASTLSTGTMGALQSVYDIVRTDSAAQEAEAEARDALVRNLCSKVNDFEHRFADLEARLSAADAKRRADEIAAREQEEEELEPIELPPEFLEDDTHVPSGELHAVQAKEEEPLDDMGGVPLSYKKVPMSYVRGGPKDQAGDLPEELEEDLPEPPPEPKGSVYPQPVAISLNKE